MGKLTEKAIAETERLVREEEATRTTRALEKENAALKSKLAATERKRKQAEADLDLVHGQRDFLGSLGQPKAVPFDYERRKPSGDATAVIVLGDWHVEETVDPDTINGLNEYNLSVAEKRIKKMFENAVALIEAARGMSSIKDLVVAVLGDMITGHIHEDLVEHNSLSPTEATLFAQDHIAGGLDFLLKHSGCKTITVPTCWGNHGRTTPTRRIAGGYAHSFEWLMYNHLERAYRNQPKVTWKVEKGYFNWLDIQGKRTRFHHGDDVKYGGGVLGIGVPANKALNEWNKTKPADFDFFQHWHQHLRVGYRAQLGNCVIGYNAYAESIKAAMTQPSQTLAIFDKKRPVPVLIQEIFCD